MIHIPLELNPYQNRMAVTEPDEFIGRERIVKDLYRLFSHPKPLSSSVYGERRIGKSSLLNFLMHPDQVKKRGLAPSIEPGNFLFVRMDLSSFKFEDASQGELQFAFFKSMFYSLHQAVVRWFGAGGKEIPGGIPGLYERSQAMSNAAQLVNLACQPYLQELAAAAPDLHVILLLDEADELIKDEAGFPLRALIADPSTRLAVALFTKWRIVDLDPAGEVSPLNNVLTEMPLGLLPENEARELIEKPAKDIGQPFPAFAVNWIYRQGGGHPDFIKITARHVFQALPGISNEAGLAALMPAITSDLEPACRSLLKSIRDYNRGLPENVQIDAALEDILQGRQTHSLPVEAVNMLLNRGTLTRGSDGSLRVFSPIFERYAWQKLGQKDKTYAAPLAPPEELRIKEDLLEFNGRQVPLTKRETAVLGYLIQRSGQTCPREEMYEEIWGAPFKKEENTAAFNIVIQRIRDKLEAANLDERINIVSERKQQGYKLITR